MTQSEFEIRLPATTGDADALALLDRVRSYALGLHFSDVSPMWRLSGREFSVDLNAWGRRPLPRFRHLRVRDIGTTGAQSPHASDPRLDVAGFFVRVKPWSKSVAIALLRPASPAAPHADDEDRSWYWAWRAEELHADVRALLNKAGELGLNISWRAT